MNENDVRRIVLDVIGRRDNTLANSVIAYIDGGRLEQSGHQGVNGRAVDGGLVWGLSTSSSGSLPGPFEMTLSSGSATFTNCVLQRDYCFISHADLTASVSESGDVWVGVSFTEATGDMSIITGSALTDVAFASRQEDESVIRVPLYKLTNGSVVCDYRKAPNTGLYI